MINTHLNRMIWVSGTNNFPIIFLSNKKQEMRRGMRKLRKFKVGRYAACMIDINDYLNALPGPKACDKIAET